MQPYANGFANSGCFLQSGSISTLATQFRQLEYHAGIGEEILLCLKRDKSVLWGQFADLDEAVDKIREQEEFIQSKTDASPLRVEAIFADRDGLIGQKGAVWFDNLCTKHKGWLQYNSMTIQDTRHNEAMLRCLPWMMQELSRTWEGGTPTDDGGERNH